MQRKPTRAWWSGYDCLYGKGKAIAAAKKPDPKPLVPSEDEEQVKLSTWLTKKGVLHYHTPNGGKRNYVEAVKLKRMGVSPGVPDLCIPLPRKAYHGLYIELKRVQGGKVSDAQKYWIEELTKNGYLAVICKGADEAIRVVEDYLKKSDI